MFVEGMLVCVEGICGCLLRKREKVKSWTDPLIHR